MSPSARSCDDLRSPMLFQTTEFALFFVAVLLLSAVLARHRSLRHLLLLVASYVFYMAWNSLYLVLIVFSTLLDYWVGAAIHASQSPRARKMLLAVSLVGNLGVLGIFKYYDFFVGNFEHLLGAVGLTVSAPVLNVILPVGISFYTFQSLSYTLDIYWRRLSPARNLLEFSLFVAFFPQLVAGPIVRAREFLPQLQTTPTVTSDMASSGLYLFLKGMFKKVVFADLLGVMLVDPVFKHPSEYGGLWMLLAILGFKLQIYCDFSGYSDMAIGCGGMLGYRLPVNFRSPYKAASIREYWRRWHITLGSWFRDYVFFPLGGSRGGPLRTYRNLLVTFLLVGLWHGASWTFVIWGGYYGVLLCLERLLAPNVNTSPDAAFVWRRRVPMVLLTLVLTSVATAIFRVADLKQLMAVFDALASPTNWGAGVQGVVVVVFTAAAITHFLPESWKEGAEASFVRLPAFVQAVALVLVLVIVRLAMTQANPFYYFQF